MVILLKHNLSAIIDTIKPQQDVSDIHRSLEYLADNNHLFVVTSVDYDNKTFNCACMTSKYNQKNDYVKQLLFKIDDPSNSGMMDAKEGIAIHLYEVVPDLPFIAGYKQVGYVKEEVLADFSRARL